MVLWVVKTACLVWQTPPSCADAAGESCFSFHPPWTSELSLQISPNHFDNYGVLLPLYVMWAQVAKLWGVKGLLLQWVPLN